jgi:hypothetical protein
MTIGLDSNGQRIRPTRGGRAKCQICTEELIAHCGDIYTWHWQHRQDRDCDPWKEHETEWHRGWKNKFPKDWQEVVMTNEDGEKHLADIKTQDDLVIEFQNSSISTTTIEIREEFYGDMIWVINAQEFKDNFKIWSAVKSKLRKLEQRLDTRTENIEYDLNEEIKELGKEIETKENLRTNKFNELKGFQKDLQLLEESLVNIAQLSERVITYWKTSSYDYFISSLTSKFDPVYKQSILTNDTETKALKKEINELKGQKKRIEAKPDIEFENRLLKVIEANELSKSNYHKAILIKRDSINTFFKVSEKIRNDMDFNNLHYRVRDFLIAIDPTDALKAIEQKIERSNQDLREKESVYEDVKQKMTDTLKKALTDKISRVTKVVDSVSSEDDDLLAQLSDLQIKVEMKKLKKHDELTIAKQQVKDEREEKRFEVMTANKGVYYYDWKHERTTWRVANSPIYFDMGDGTLFRKVSDGQFQKYSDEDFVKIYGVKITAGNKMYKT